MRDDVLFERAVSWYASEIGEARLLGARHSFEERTGPIIEGATDYESRMAHFYEQHMCEDVGEQMAPIAAFALAHRDLPQQGLRQLAGWLRSHRSLFAFEGWQDDRGRVRDLILGGSYRFTPQGADHQLTLGDRFDGRILPLAEGLHLSQGRVYHARAAFFAIDQLLASEAPRQMPLRMLLDALLRMRSRLLSFGSIRAEHVYRVDALADGYFSASWAHPDRR